MHNRIGVISGETAETEKKMQNKRGKTDGRELFGVFRNSAECSAARADTRLITVDIQRGPRDATRCNDPARCHGQTGCAIASTMMIPAGYDGANHPRRA